MSDVVLPSVAAWAWAIPAFGQAMSLFVACFSHFRKPDDAGCVVCQFRTDKCN